jgi:uncharacterized protein
MEPLASVIVIHGFDGNPDDSWKPWLRQELLARHVALAMPQMPEPATPKLFDWLKTIDTLVESAVEPIILVGHSLGGTAVLRYVESTPSKPILACISLAGVVDPAPYDQEAYPFRESFFETPIDLARVRTNVGHLIGIYSRDDTDVAFDQAEKFQQEGSAELLDVDGYGHFSEEDSTKEIPELLQVIDSLIQLAK